MRFTASLRTLPALALFALIMPVAAWGGLFFPDLDLALMPLIGHRSIITHSALAPVLMLSLGRRRFMPQTIAWFSFGIATHLVADIFSRGWTGFALIKLPFGLGNLGLLSPLWIGLNALVALWICEWLLRNEGKELSWLHRVGSTLAVVLYMLLNEGKPWLAVLAGGAWLGALYLVRTRFASRRSPMPKGRASASMWKKV